ncbi:hypothetical protein N0B16_10310 [Chryseobacterium sp. GMJ5]|uniref:Uncharacterized protein n=1 Tax=Chryseobacterium gilvum TaxID=2976534 RepID=A0ABT2VXV4_9FLAO|nr:hypothetical protein [Chryseobacterium gilvum]MCU7614829.1 hypothetical protein [Chryseobacterium gilvum]
MEKLLNNIFRESNNQFLEQEMDNISNDVIERNLCGRLAIYLNDKIRENKLIDYFVDTEYNRKQNGQVKTILDDEFNIININCDIIVHSRGNNISADNLIAIEMKKSNRPEQEKITDKKRLRALTKESYDDIWSNDGVTLPEHVCGYILGYYIELNIKEKQCLIEVYKKGNKTNEWTQEF